MTAVQCRTHRRSFTLYPLGHIPYGRLAVAPVTLDGQVMLSTESEITAGGRRSPAWHAAQFEPAFAAIDDPSVRLTDRRWWKIQTPERLAQSAALRASVQGSRCRTPKRSHSRLELQRLGSRQATDSVQHRCM